MQKKPPALFRKRVPETLLEKKLLRYLEQPADREYLRSCFTLHEGMYSFTGEVTGENGKRLKSLAKAIRANRKLPVRALPLIAALAAGIGGFVFFAFFFNPVLEKALERGLETIFEARVTIDRFRLNLLKFSVGIDHAAIADRDDPMSNLVEMGRIRLSLNPRAVLQGKIYIEEIRTENLRFGTARESSGALPSRPARTKPEPPRRETPPLIDLARFDPGALLEREMGKLQSLRLYYEAAAFCGETLDKWNARLGEGRQQIAEIEAAARPFTAFNINSIDIRDPASLDRARRIIDDARRALETVQSSIDMINSITAGIEEDLRAAKQLEKNAESAVAADLARLGAYIDFQGDAWQELLEPLLGDILSDAGRKYLRYGQRLLETLDRVKALQGRLPKTEKKRAAPAFRGRTVHFPSRRYPFFSLGVMASDFVLDGWKWNFELRNVSSDPDLSGGPAAFLFSLAEEAGAGRNAEFNASADFRTGARERFSATLAGSGFPVEITDLPAGTGLGGVYGGAAFSLEGGGLADGSFTIGGGISLVDWGIRNPQGTIGNAVAGAAAEAGTVRILLRHVHPASGNDRFTVETNIGNLVMDALGRTVRAFAGEARAKLEQALRGRIASLAGGNLSPAELEDILALARGDGAALLRLRNSLQTRIGEIENRVRRAAGEVIDSAREQAEAAEAEARRLAAEAEAEARRRAEEARRQAEEARRQAEAEARRLAEEAEAEARRRAEEARRQAEDRAREAVRGRLPF